VVCVYFSAVRQVKNYRLLLGDTAVKKYDTAFVENFILFAAVKEL